MEHIVEHKHYSGTKYRIGYAYQNKLPESTVKKLI